MMSIRSLTLLVGCILAVAVAYTTPVAAVSGDTFILSSATASQGVGFGLGMAKDPTGTYILNCYGNDLYKLFLSNNSNTQFYTGTPLSSCLGVVINRAGTLAFVTTTSAVLGIDLSSPSTNAVDVGSGYDQTSSAFSVNLIGLAIDGNDNLFFANNQDLGSGAIFLLRLAAPTTPLTSNPVTVFGVGAYTITGFSVDYTAGQDATVAIYTTTQDSTNKFGWFTTANTNANSWSTAQLGFDLGVNTYTPIIFEQYAPNEYQGYTTNGTVILSFRLDTVLPAANAFLVTGSSVNNVASFLYDYTYDMLEAINNNAFIRIVTSPAVVSVDFTSVTKGTGAQTVALVSNVGLLYPTTFALTVTTGGTNAASFPATITIPAGQKWAPFTLTAPGVDTTGAWFSLAYAFDAGTSQPNAIKQFASSADPSADPLNGSSSYHNISTYDTGMPGFSSYRQTQLTSATQPILKDATSLIHSVSGSPCIYYTVGVNVYKYNITENTNVLWVTGGPNNTALIDIAVDANYIYAIDTANVYRAPIASASTFGAAYNTASFIGALGGITAAYNMNPVQLFISSNSGIQAIITGTAGVSANLLSSGPFAPFYSTAGGPNPVLPVGAISVDGSGTHFVWVYGPTLMTGYVNVVITTLAGYANYFNTYNTLGASLPNSPYFVTDVAFDWQSTSHSFVYAVDTSGALSLFSPTKVSNTFVLDGNLITNGNSNQHAVGVAVGPGVSAYVLTAGSTITKTIDHVATRTAYFQLAGYQPTVPVVNNPAVVTLTETAFDGSPTNLPNPYSGSVSGTFICGGVAGVSASNPALTIAQFQNTPLVIQQTINPTGTGTMQCWLTALSGTEAFKFSPTVRGTVTVVAAGAITFVTPPSQFYSNGVTLVSWSSTYQASQGGASLTIDCGASKATPSSWQCLSASSGSFAIIGGPVGAGVACTLTVTGEEASYYAVQSGQTYAVASAVIPIVAQDVFFVDPPTSLGAPLSVRVGDTLNVNLVAPSTASGVSFSPITVTCTNVASLSTSGLTAQFGVQNASYPLTFTQVGNVLCQHTYGGSFYSRLAPIPSLYLTVLPALPPTPPTTLTVSALTPAPGNGLSVGNYGVTINNPLSAAGGQLAVGLSCSSIGVTGTQVSSATVTPNGASGVSISGGGSVATFTTNAATSVTFNVQVPIVADGLSAYVTCSFISLSGSSASKFTYPSTPASFWFFVGQPKSITAAVSSTPVQPLQADTDGSGSIDVTLVPQTTSITITSDLTVTATCVQGGNVITVQPVYYSAGLMTNQTWTFTTPSTGGQVNCSYDITGTDAPHFTSIANTFFQVNPLKTVTLNAQSLPANGILAPSTTANVTYTVTITNPNALSAGAGENIVVELDCGNNVDFIAVTGSSSAVTGTSWSPYAGAYSGAATFSGSAAGASATFVITTFPFAQIGQSAYISCSFGDIGGSVGMNYDYIPSNIQYSIFQQTSLLAVVNGSSTITAGQTRAVSIVSANAALEAVVYPGLNMLEVDASCVICTDTGYGSLLDGGNNWITPTGAFNGTKISGNVFTFTAIAPGTVTCSFTLSSNDAPHFQLAPIPNVVFTVNAAPTPVITNFNIAVSGGVTAPVTGVAFTPTPTRLPVVGGASQTFNVSVAAPMLNVDLTMSCFTIVGITPTVVAYGGSSAGGQTITWTSTNGAGGYYLLTVTNPTAPAGLNVFCTFDNPTGTDSALINVPGGFNFYIGPVVPLLATYTQSTPLYANSASSQITIAPAATTPTEGWETVVVCVSDNPQAVLYANGGGAPLGPSGFLAFAYNGPSVATSYNIKSTQPGTVTCSYSALTVNAAADYLHFTAPTTTTTIVFLPVIAWTIGGTAYSSAGPLTLASGSAATLTVTPTIPLTTETAKITVICSYMVGGNQHSTIPLAMSPSSGPITVDNTTTTLTFSFTLPITGTASTHLGETVSCVIIPSSLTPISHFNGANIPVTIWVGAATTLAITPQFTGPMYLSSSSFQNTYQFKMVASPWCNGEAYATITGICGNYGGSIAFAGGASPGSRYYTGLISGPIAFTWSPSSPYTPGNFTCTFSISSAQSVYLQPATLSFTLVRPNPVTIVGLDNTLVAGQTKTVTITLGTVTNPVPAPPKGVTVNLWCDSTQGNTVTFANGQTKFYFFEGTFQQSIVATAASDFVVGKCYAQVENIFVFATASDVLSDSNKALYESDQQVFTVGALRTWTYSAPTPAPATCSDTTITVTLSAAPFSYLDLSFNCHDPLGSAYYSPVTVRFTDVTASFTYTSGRRAANVYCDVQVSGGSTADIHAYQSSSSVSWVSGTPNTFDIIRPTTLTLTPGASATFTVNPHVPVDYLIDLRIYATNGGILSTGILSWKSTDGTLTKTFTVTAPTIAAGVEKDIVVSFQTSNSDGPYFTAPTSTTFQASPTNTIALTVGGSLVVGSTTATITVTPAAAVGLATSVTISCTGVTFAAGATTSVVAFAAGTGVPVTVTATLPSTAGSVTCTASVSGPGAFWISPINNLAFTVTATPATSSSTAGGGGTGGASSSTGSNPDCQDCGSATQAIPSIFAYLTVALFTLLVAR